jgi:putative DNA primase/helicase
LCGICLTAVVDEQVLPVLYGDGSNGKSTLIYTILGLLGNDLAMPAPPGILLRRHHEAHPAERTALYGKRFVPELETDDGITLNEALVKRLTGKDVITGRGMRENFWSFVPTHKLMLCTNHKPRIVGRDEAIWRRIKLIPFLVTIEDKDAVKDMAQLLVAEYSGILNRCIQGCLDWQEHGLPTCKAVQYATKEYRQGEDVLCAFITEECITDPGVRCRAGALYGRYKHYSEEIGGTPISERAFSKAMGLLKYEKKSSNGMWYLGIALRDPPARPDHPDFNWNGVDD